VNLLESAVLPCTCVRAAWRGGEQTSTLNILDLACPPTPTLALACGARRRAGRISECCGRLCTPRPPVAFFTAWRQPGGGLGASRRSHACIRAGPGTGARSKTAPPGTRPPFALSLRSAWADRAIRDGPQEFSARWPRVGGGGSLATPPGTRDKAPLAATPPQPQYSPAGSPAHPTPGFMYAGPCQARAG